MSERMSGVWTRIIGGIALVLFGAAISFGVTNQVIGEKVTGQLAYSFSL